MPSNVGHAVGEDRANPAIDTARVWHPPRMWKQRAASALERGTRWRPVRLALRQVTQRGILPPNALQFMHIEPEFTVDIGDGLGTFRYSATEADAVGRHLFWTGLSRWEVECWREFIPLARTARGFLDVGAFTGCYSLVAATVNPSLRALAFEPVPGVYDRLTTNIAINNLASRVTAIPAAVSNSNGTERFFIPDRPMPDTGFLQSSLRESEEAGTWHPVQTTTIEAALPDGFHVDLVKIDVEDAEGPVVESMRDVLEQHRPTILIEFLATGSYEQAGAVLGELGYDISHLTDVGRVPVAQPQPEPDARFMNYLCVPR